jgi:hypothetical protein
VVCFYALARQGYKKISEEVQGTLPVLLPMSQDQLTPKKTSLFLRLLFIVAVLGMLLTGCSSNQVQFDFFAGDEALIVLLREDETGSYQVRYTGNQPAQIRNIQTMIAGEILHVDVEQVRLINQNSEVLLVDNNVPEGQVFELQPQEEFNIQVTFSGQSIGYNYLHGFRINFDVDNNNTTEDIVDPEVPDGYQYLINVE